MRNAGTYDYIIVGAGTAGCLLANRLSADPDVSVLLLEAGGKDDWMWIHIPVGYLYCINNPRTDWCFQTEPEAELNGRVLRYPRGKVLGGSSSINAMLYLRGQARDYDEWAQLTGDSGWAWQNVLPVFMKTEDHWRGADEKHGEGGEWRVEATKLRWDVLESFRAAANESGIPWTDDFNRGDNSGVSRYEVNQKNGVRWNASKAFLRPAMNRPNLTVLTGAHTKRLRLAGRRVEGVEFFQTSGKMSGSASEEVFAAARRDTILSAGAIGSPQILQLSGIGPGALLQKHGIPVVHDAPVGDNLQDHLQLRMAFKVKNALTLNTMLGSWLTKAKMGLDYALFREGPLTMAALAARRVREVRSGASHARSSIPRAADLARSLRRSAAPVSRVHRQRVQPAADRPRDRAHRVRRSARLPGDRAQLPVHRRGQEDRRRRAASRAPHRDRHRCDEEARARGIHARSRFPVRRAAARGRRQDRHDDFPPGGHVQDGPRRRPDRGRGH